MKKSILTLALGGMMGIAAVGLFAFQPDETLADVAAASNAVEQPTAEATESTEAPTAAPAVPGAPKSGDILVVRNTIGSAAWSKIVTTYPDGKTEVIKLANFDPQNFVNNNELLTEQLNKVQNEGYKLVGTSGGGAGGGFVISYYVFEKI